MIKSLFYLIKFILLHFFLFFSNSVFRKYNFRLPSRILIIIFSLEIRSLAKTCLSPSRKIIIQSFSIAGTQFQSFPLLWNLWRGIWETVLKLIINFFLISCRMLNNTNLSITLIPSLLFHCRESLSE